MADLPCTTGIFRDIDLRAHRNCVERMCRETGKVPIVPLWQNDREDVLDTFIDSSCKTMIITVNTHYPGKEWLGRIIDRDLIPGVRRCNNVDSAGEKGAYHTFIFKRSGFSNTCEIFHSRVDTER